MQMFMSCTSFIQQNGLTPLVAAAENDHVEIMELLYNSGGVISVDLKVRTASFKITACMFLCAYVAIDTI